jgi:CheY-like chemotaxis protein
MFGMKQKVDKGIYEKMVAELVGANLKIKAEQKRALDEIKARAAALNNASNRVLICEDDPGQSILYSHLIADMGFEPVVTYSGKDCLTIIKTQNNFRALLVDFTLPDMDGLEILKSIYDKTFLKFVVSGKEFNHEELASLIRYADGLYKKPLTDVACDDLLLRIRDKK